MLASKISESYAKALLSLAISTNNIKSITKLVITQSNIDLNAIINMAREKDEYSTLNSVIYDKMKEFDKKKVKKVI